VANSAIYRQNRPLPTAEPNILLMLVPFAPECRYFPVLYSKRHHNIFRSGGGHPTIYGWRENRAIVAGPIEKLERKLKQHRADLTHIDGVLRLFQLDRDPDEFKPKPLTRGALAISRATNRG
jgi:hypothetical protein